ncbi:amidohydrolase family protein [Erythrobacter sp. NFXS35]|uniref:amidohydrolase family protein n=1 Tax=Erythrobacter sp. NFXS35 TaxID=2818436 RepID=UPI0032DF80A3
MTRWARRALAVLTVLCFAVGVVWLVVFRVPAPPAPAHQGFVLDGVTIINPMQDRSSDTRIVVQGGIFARDAGAGSDLPVLEQYRGRFVLPGFIDMHTHLPGDNLLKLTQHYGLLHLAHGVTTIRTAGDIDGTADVAARELIAAQAPFPHLISCGPFVSRGGKVWPNSLLIETPADAERAVARIAAGDHGCVKAYEGLNPVLIAALVRAADARGLQVIGHVPVDLTFEKAGVPDVQHFFGVPDPSGLHGHDVTYRNGDWTRVDEARLEAIKAHVLASGIRNTPTIATLEGFGRLADPTASARLSSSLLPTFFAEVVWNARTGLPVYRGINGVRFDQAGQALRLKQRLVKQLSDGGAVLHLGTDVGQPFTAPGWSFWRELRLFGDAGVAPEQALAYATNVAGASLGNGAGRVSIGGRADLLIFARDPTRSLDALDSLEAVVVTGRLYTRRELNEAVKGSLAHYEAWPLRLIARSAAQRTVDEAARNFGGQGKH